MVKLFGESSIFSNINTSQGSTILAITFIAITALLIIAKIKKLSVPLVIYSLIKWLRQKFARIVYRKEKQYHRDIEIGKINEKRTKVKLYRFLSELIIDLGLYDSGMKPYELLMITCTLVGVGTAVLVKMLFGSLWMVIPAYPLAIVGTFCIMYTKANIAHDTRIENVIEAENIICSNIKSGVVVAVRDSLNVLPEDLKDDFKDFLDNIEHKNYHIKTALLELNQRLGSIADDFIKKCIVFELEEEHGIASMFQDIVEINNIKSEMRTEMKRGMEVERTNFILGASMIFVFLGGVLGIYPDIRKFYFNHPIGQIIILIDILIIIADFVYVTYLTAQDV